MNIPPLQPRVDAADVPLERLAGNATVSEEQKVAEAARQFEAMLVRQILSSANKSVIRSSLSSDSTADGIYRDMINDHLADSVSRSGALGLAQVLSREFSRQNCVDPKSTAPAEELHQQPAAAIQKFLKSPKALSQTQS